MKKRGLICLLLICLLMVSGCGLKKDQDVTLPATQPVTEGTKPSQVQVIATDPPAPTEPPVTEPPLPATVTTPPQELGLTASHAFVYHTGNDHMVYMGGDGEESLAPASLTKLLTAYTARQILPPEAVITVGSEITWIDPLSSRAWISQGQQLSVEMLIEGMLLPSGNDAAYTLAVGCGRALAEDPDLDRKMALNVFVDEMNAQARELGMKNSHFANPDGIDQEGHYTCMEDLLILSLAVMEDPLIMQYTGMASDSVIFASGETITWKNSNYLLHPEVEKYYTPSAIGLKTGSTEKAGKCLISAFQLEGGQHLIVCVLGSIEDENRYDDTLLLYNLYR